MRIIAGEFRGTNLHSPKGEGTRPMLDRMKESLFSILGGHFDGMRALDLFAGTGSLGLEAISRGATHCTFLESDPSALEVLRRNVEKLRVGNRARVLKWDALSWRPPAPKAGSEGTAGEPERFDLFFYDPPYKLLQGTASLRTRVIDRFGKLFSEMGSERAMGAFHFPRDLLDRSELAGIPNLDLREYGTSSIAVGRNQP